MSAERVALIDGELATADGARVSVWDRGFLYGDGIFETMRAYGGRVFAAPEHVARLGRSARAIGISLPVPETTLVEEIHAARAASSLVDAAVRLVVTRGAGVGASALGEMRATRVILVDPLPPLDPAHASGLPTIAVPWTPPIVAGAKLSSYLPHLLAMAEARRRGAGEALLVDERGRIREGATSNVFVVDGGALITAPVSDAILPGITRAHVLEAAARLGITIRLESPELHLATHADEVFVTSTFRELLPVSSIDGAPVGRSRATVDALHRAFRDAVAAGGS